MYQVLIKRIKDGEIVKVMPAADAKQAEMIERGVLHNLNHNEYFVTTERGQEKR